MKKNRLIKEVLKLLESYKNKYEDNLKKAFWVSENNYIDYPEDFCENCINEAVYEVRKEYLLNQRKLPITERDYPFSVFRKRTYFSSNESDYFRTCDDCGASLECSIILNRELIEEVIEDISKNEIDDYMGYKAHSLIENYIYESKENKEFILKLATLIIKKCENLTLNLQKTKCG